jgi:GNAT superfamily N-acetyltransferase
MTISQRAAALEDLRRVGGGDLGQSETGMDLVEVRSPAMRKTFDEACESIHYAGACHRVGRLMRLAIRTPEGWAGGVVLGSPFPNIAVRDRAIGLREHAVGWRERGLTSPWASENREYWDSLQSVVNHARTFVFPTFQGKGVGVEAHRLLLDAGRDLWEARYKAPIKAFDTLCTSNDSRMFLENGWSLVGRTKGYSRDPKRALSRRLADSEDRRGRDNAGLSTRLGNQRWWVWVRPL